MLYTTYLSKINKIPKLAKKIIVTRIKPKWIECKGSVNHIWWMQSLSPSYGLLKRYKLTNDWDQYVKDFREEIKNRKDLKKMLDVLEQLIKNNPTTDYYLICYEKDYAHCHRYLLAKELENRGIEWKELM